MNNSETRLNEIEAQRSTDVSRDQQARICFHMNLLHKAARTLFCSRGFTQSIPDDATPPTEDNESLPELSDLYNLPGETVAMSSEISCAMRAGHRAFLENMKSLETPMACFKNEKGDSILHIVAALGHLELVKSIVSICPSLLLEPNYNDQIPLHVAVCAGHSEVVKALVESIKYFSARLAGEGRERLNLYVLRDTNGDTPLHLALKEFLMCQQRPIYVQFLPRRLPLYKRLIRAFLKPMPLFNEPKRSFSNASKRLIETAACLVDSDQCASFLANKDGVSPLYMAVEAGNISLVNAMLNHPSNNVQGNNTSDLASHFLQLEGRKSLVHAALKSKKIDVLDVILKADPNLANERDEEGRTCISVGASVGFYEGLCMLLDTTSLSIFDCDNDGSFPIHMAVEKCHKNVFQELLKHFPNSVELLNRKGQNVFHIAAKSGKARSFLMDHIKGVDTRNRLMEEQDVDGNTPIHVATINWRPKTVYMLVYVCSTTLNYMSIQNADGLRPLDIAEKNLQLDYVFRERMTLMVLLGIYKPSWLPTSGMTLRSRSEKVAGGRKYKDLVQVLLVVAALVATVTFAAGFTIPGGFNSSAPKSGMAILVDDWNLTAFLFCDAIAMYSSIAAIVTLIWAQLGDHELAYRAFHLALPLLFAALTFMSAAFYFGVYATIKHNRVLRIILLTVFVIFFTITTLTLVPYVIPQYRDAPFFRFVTTLYLLALLWFVNEDDMIESTRHV